ncbi:MAG: tungsten formylmethanofuran dehydrogenase [Methylovirgula sp.]
MKAFVDGAAVGIDAAAAAAARLLGNARLPVIAGLGTDLAGARSAIALAEKLRGAYDHLASDILLRDIDVMRQAGRMITSANDVRLRADCVCFVGPKLFESWPDLPKHLDLAAPPRLSATKTRKVFWIGASRGEAAAVGATEIAASPASMPHVLANLRAAVLERKTRANGGQKLAELAAQLKAAHFGAFVCSADSLDRLAIEMLQGLIVDLNEKTRFSTLALGPGGNALGVVQTSGWMTGFPIRTGFGRGYPEHDIWRFDVNRMVDADEADAALWISAYSNEVPQWKRHIPFVALAKPQTRFLYPPRVKIEVGAPGEDHDAIEFSQEIATFALTHAKSASDAPRVADVIGRIEQNLTKGSEAC